MSMIQCALPCHTIPASRDDQGSLLSIPKRFHKTYLFMPLSSSKGQILWIDRRSTFFLMTLIFICADIHFLIMYSSLIFVMQR